MSAQHTAVLTADQYLAIEREAEFKSEFFQGKMYAMAGATLRHTVLANNFGGELRSALKGRGCRVSTSDLRVCTSEHGLYTYPDVTVLCGEPLFFRNRKDTVLNPTLLIEIISKATEAHDRGFKSAQYRQIQSVREYLMVSQTEPRVERFRRDSKDQWMLIETLGLHAVLRLDSLDVTIPMSELYENIEFTPDE